MRLRRKWYRNVALFVATGWASSASAQTLPAPSLSFPQASDEGFTWGVSTGIDYSTGSYGAKCTFQTISVTCTSIGTTVIDIPSTGMVQVGRLRLEATVPWVHIEGPGKIAGVFGVVPTVVAPTNTEPKSRSGLGDITAGVAVVVSREDVFLPRLEIEGVAKLPTAADGLGTGKTDYGAQLNVFKTVLPGLTAFGSLGYQWIGDINTVSLHSGARATAGAEFHFISITAGGLLDYRQSTWQGSPDYFAFDPYARLDVIAGLGVEVYGTFGMTRSSPSSGFGVRLTL
jgi:hypothetical protein